MPESDISDSDEDYNENEKILLNKVRNRNFQDSDSEREVYGVGASDDSGESDIALSDVEGQEEKDDLPDIRAWGKKKGKFYHTDYVDQDYGGFQGKDAHLAELEEEEAKNLQQQLVQQLDDDDFQLDIVTEKKIEDDVQISEELIKTDISKLSKRQQLQILKKESPEFFGLVEDFEIKISIAKDFLSPILTKYRAGELPHSPVIEFVLTQHDLILNYCTNIQMYLLLKASKVNVQNHPVIKRLYQYRQLLTQLNPIFEEKIKPQIKDLLEAKKPKQLNILTELNKKKNIKTVKEKPKQNDIKKVKFNENIEEHEASEQDDDDDEKEEQEEDNNEVGKRAITYQMAKNKGLTPHRKKEQRNPRVKHRNKFRKAKIRRRGAVREARTEMSRYGGEISGIKTSVSKSIKIKS